MALDERIVTGGWLPVRVRNEEVTWMEVGGRVLREPFFDWDVGAWHEAAPEGLPLAKTSLADLAAAAELPDLAAPAGFVFHCSRCGSTLLARALMHARDATVISEPQPINDILYPRYAEAATEEGDAILRGLLLALGRRRAAGHRRFFVKFSSWNVLLIATLRRVFPEVPAVFLFRDPAPVIASQLARPAGFAEWGDDAFSQFVCGASEPELRAMNPERYLVRSVARLLRAGAEAEIPALNYRDLVPEHLPAILAAAFDLTLSAEESAAMAAEFPHCAKAPRDEPTAYAPGADTLSPELTGLVAAELAGLAERLDRGALRPASHG